MRPAFFIFLLAALSGSLTSAAQTVTVSDPVSIRNDYGYEIVGRLRDRILVFRDRYDNFEVQAYDSQLRLSWSHELEDLDRRGAQVLAVVGGKNDFSVIFRLKRRGTTYLRVHKYDPAAHLIDSMTVKNYGERVFNPPVLELTRSEDRNCFVVYNTADHDQLEAVCFRLDAMQVVWDKTAFYANDFSEDHLKTMALSNAGVLFLVSEFNNRRIRQDEHRYHILEINASSDVVRNVPLRDFLTVDAKFVYDNRNNYLVGAGLWGEKNRDRANGCFFLRASAADTSYTLHYEPFDDQFISVLRRKDVADDTRGISDADVTQVILRQDGGVALVTERHYDIQRGAVNGRGFMRDGARLVIDYYYDDLFVIGLNPEGLPQWKTVLHKKQYSQDDEAIFSSYFLMRNADRLHFLFNDEIKYENTCSDYVVSASGSFDRNSLLNTFSQNLRLRFREGLQLSTGECLVPSEFRSKLRLVLIRY